MDCLRLVVPKKKYEHKAKDYIREFIEYNSQIHGVGGLHRYENYDEWLNKLEQDSDNTKVKEGRVSADTYFFVREPDDKIVGMINIRHNLNEILLKEGGHIGYSIRPTERRKGYATMMLKQALIKCKGLSIEKALIVCDKINIASARVIQNNKGVLENELYSDTYSQIIQRYWIEV